jgi:hypothetical protein
MGHFHHHHCDNNPPPCPYGCPGPCGYSGPSGYPGWSGDACWDNYAVGNGGYCPTCGHMHKHSCGHHGDGGYQDCDEHEHCLKKLLGHFHHKCEKPNCGPCGCPFPPATYFGGYISEGCDACWSN